MPTRAALNHLLVTAWRDNLKIVMRDRDAARSALLDIRDALNLALPSEQTGPEWEQCVRVPLARLILIDAAITRVLGEPIITNEPMPALHGPAAAGGEE